MRKLQEQGLKIDTKTLFSQTEVLYLNLAPIMDLIKEEILRLATFILTRPEERFYQQTPMVISGRWETVMGRTFNMRPQGQEKSPLKC